MMMSVCTAEYIWDRLDIDNSYLCNRLYFSVGRMKQYSMLAN